MGPSGPYWTLLDPSGPEWARVAPRLYLAPLFVAWESSRLAMLLRSVSWPDLVCMVRSECDGRQRARGAGVTPE